MSEASGEIARPPPPPAGQRTRGMEVILKRRPSPRVTREARDEEEEDAFLRTLNFGADPENNTLLPRPRHAGESRLLHRWPLPDRDPQTRRCEATSASGRASVSAVSMVNDVEGQYPEKKSGQQPEHEPEQQPQFRSLLDSSSPVAGPSDYASTWGTARSKGKGASRGRDIGTSVSEGRPAVQRTGIMVLLALRP